MTDIDELLSRGVDTIYPSREQLKEVLRSRKIRLYQGFDPTGDKLHIGHMVGLRKLAQFQRAGHHVIFLIGTATGQAGDPSGKTTARESFLSQEVLEENARDYVMQAKKIIDFDTDNVEIRYNSEWFNKMSFSEFLTQIGHFSLQQLVERDLFQDRIGRGESINMRAFIYPILQAYDSVQLDVDLEIGGTDQTFNMLFGRDLVRQTRLKEKFVLTTPLLTDSQGIKIGKSEGNVIALTDAPEDLFGKVMGLSDDIIAKGLEYLTDIPIGEVRSIEKKISSGENPMQYKKMLAFEIVKQLNSEAIAQQALDIFEKGDINLPPVKQPISFISGATVSQLITASEVAGSITQSKILINQGGIRLNNEVVSDPNAPAVNYVENDQIVIQRGPRKRRVVEVTKD